MISGTKADIANKFGVGRIIGKGRLNNIKDAIGKMISNENYFSNFTPANRIK